MTPSPRPLLFIAEAGVNHNGDLGRALDMVAAAAEAGADTIKFQAFRAEEIAGETTAAAPYQKSNTGIDNQLTLLRSLELDLDDFQCLAAACRDAGIGFLCTPFDVGMARALIAMGMDRIKVPSGELTNTPALRYLGGLGLPILLSTGMASMEEVENAVTAVRESGATDVTLLHCTSLYPTPYDAINLRAMVTLAERFELPVGYSDHSIGYHVAVAATALGACVIEKHFTLDRSLPGPDHKASMEPADLKIMIQKCRETVIALGDGNKRPAPGEAETAALVRRSWHAGRDLEAGHVLAHSDIALKRPADGLPPHQSPVGGRLVRAIAAGHPIRREDLAAA